MNNREYWMNESLESYTTAKILRKKKRYLESAFFCNLACEKMLKAAFIRNTSETPPKIHSLVRLAKMAKIYDQMEEKHKRFLNRLEVFQIEGRYPESRTKIYQTTSPAEFKKILNDTSEVITWAKQQII